MAVLLAIGAGSGGCVERTINVQSNPPGALVYLNDQEIGRTPMRRDFLWYGKYEVALRMDGYQSLKTSANISAPFYEWPPLDLIAELLPLRLKDRHELSFTMQPMELTTRQSQELVDRGVQYRQDLQSSERPTTRPKK